MATAIHLLGPRRVTVDGQAWRLTVPPRALALLGYVATAGGAVPREVLAAALWPDADEEEARNNLRRHLHRLAKGLPPREEPWIAADGEALIWNGDACIDVVSFENALAAGDRRAAAACYGGDFLEGYYDDWIILQRERLSNAYVNALLDLLAEAQSARDYSGALAYAQRILQLDEWREDVVRVVMAIRYETGDRAGALGTYERFARRLGEELRVEPMPETIALRDAMVRNAPISVSAREATPEFMPGPSALPFVGRAREFERLRDLWGGIAHGTGALAFVCGPAGIGKTRLVHEFALYAQRQGARVLAGGTSNPEAIPYEALSDALRAAVPYLARVCADELWMRVLASIVPELQAQLPQYTSLEPIGDKPARSRLFEALTRVLSLLGRERPFLLVLEDVHWADSATIQALEFVARRAGGIRGIVVATYRDDEPARSAELNQARHSLERERRVVRVELSRLTREDAGMLLEQMPEIAGGPPDLASTLHRISGGNPLFLLHLARDFAETREVPQEPAAGAGIGAAIASRIAHLSDDARLVAAHAAVMGASFSVDLLGNLTGWGEDDLLGALSELTHRHVVRASFQRAQYEYAFAHDLVQRAVYETVPAAERRRLHRRIAALLENTRAEHSEFHGEIALHWDRAGDAQRAALAHLQAADAALAVYANETARNHARRALELADGEDVRYRALVQLVRTDERTGDARAWERDTQLLLDLTKGADPRRRFEALTAAARRCERAGEPEAHQAVLDEMAAIAHASGDRLQLAATMLGQGAVRSRAGAAASAVEVLRAAQAAAEQTEDADLQVQALVMLIRAFAACGRVEEAREEYERAKSDSLLQPHHRLALVRARAAVAMACEDGAELERIAQEQLNLARRIGDVEAEADAQRLFAYAAAYSEMNLEVMRDRFGEAASIFEQIGASQEYNAMLIDLAGIESELGRYEEANRLLDVAIPLAERIGWTGGIAYGVLARMEARRGLGDLAGAEQFAQRALQLSQSTELSKTRCTALVVVGWVQCMLGRSEEGLAHMREGIALRRESAAAWSLAADLCLFVEALLESGQHAAAAEAARELEDIYLREPVHQMAPAHICWTLARARRAAGDLSGYGDFVLRGRAELENGAAKFGDETVRAAFRNRPFCRELLAAELPVMAP